ncbi:hypothetical protein NC652_034006 [Populus alba x Populus x berolinensis]|uniref:dUTP diphosphatase n=2 Tax=Populus alba x Populus x berolinensis TaxID=444605 RepID=A0AAD6PZU8_9ROSI|nr:hypothetical protein NC652_034006 [Populus alba x Populus x berolinensis]KAJ6973716.1 hypothetical protein NC653_033912 [Populus alba x Populus x berolinensis]
MFTDGLVLFFKLSFVVLTPISGLTDYRSPDYKGAGVIDVNYKCPVIINRIVQLSVEKIVTPNVMEVDDFDATGRGVGGFGCTGI